MLDQEIRHTFLKVFRDQVEYFTFSSEATKAKVLLKVRLINVWRAKRAMGGAAGGLAVAAEGSGLRL